MISEHVLPNFQFLWNPNYKNIDHHISSILHTPQFAQLTGWTSLVVKYLMVPTTGPAQADTGTRGNGAFVATVKKHVTNT